MTVSKTVNTLITIFENRKIYEIIEFLTTFWPKIGRLMALRVTFNTYLDSACSGGSFDTHLKPCHKKAYFTCRSLYDSESVLSNQRGHVTRKIEKREITIETIFWVILRTQKRNFSPSESRETHFLPISIHSEFPDLPIRFWRIGDSVVRGIYDI